MKELKVKKPTLEKCFIITSGAKDASCDPGQIIPGLENGEHHIYIYTKVMYEKHSKNQQLEKG